VLNFRDFIFGKAARRVVTVMDSWWPVSTLTFVSSFVSHLLQIIYTFLLVVPILF
jgi:hypothetical protein